MMETAEPILNAHNKSEYEPAHTAEHILNQTMIRMFNCGRSFNAHVERKKSKLDYKLTSCPTQEQIVEIEQRVNDVVAQNLPVTMEFVDRDHIPAEVSLAKLPEDASETLRLVRVGDYDVCACIGQHVQNTSEIGHFRISSTSWNAETSTFRIVFRLDNPSEKY